MWSKVNRVTKQLHFEKRFFSRVFIAVGIIAVGLTVSQRAGINEGDWTTAVQENQKAYTPSAPQSRKRLNISAMGNDLHSITIVKFAANSTADLNPSQIINSRDVNKAKLSLGKYRPDQFPRGITSPWHIDLKRSKEPSMTLLQNIAILQMYELEAYLKGHTIYGFSPVDAPPVQNYLDQVEQEGNTTIDRFEHAIFFHNAVEHNIQHFFFDCIPRLWIYKELKAAGVHPIVLISPTTLSFVPQTLEMMGFPYRILGKNPVIVDNLYKSLNYNLNFRSKNPDASYLWELIAQVRAAALAHVGLATAAGNRLVPSYERIYLSRMRDDKSGKGRQLENEADLAQRLGQRGFAILNAGDYNIPQRSELLRHTKVICSLMGAGLTNILFAAPNTNAIIIGHPHFTGSWFKDTVGPTLNIPVKTIDGLGVVTAPSTSVWSSNERWILDVGKAIQQIDAILSSDDMKH